MRSRRRLLNRLAAVAFAVMVGLAFAELIVRIQEARNIGVQSIKDGLLSYDERLGWRLTPGWQGRHTYSGFDAGYTIDESGFRRQAGIAVPATNRTRILVLGDSFTFGIGVSDDETFVARLNERASTWNAPVFLNAGVPGYSTDQQVLRGENILELQNASRVVLAVCLANDLLDNPRVYPIHTHLGKPRYELREGRLELTNVPVPRVPKAPWNAGEELSRAMLGASWRQDLATRISRWSALARMVHRDVLALRNPKVSFDSVQQENLELFWAIVGRIEEVCRQKNARLHLALIPGSSMVLYPDSYSGQYQRYVRSRILERATEKRLAVLDVAWALMEAEKSGRRGLFLNDGHLSPDGHRIAAEAIGSGMETD